MLVEICLSQSTHWALFVSTGQTIFHSNHSATILEQELPLAFIHFIRIYFYGCAMAGPTHLSYYIYFSSHRKCAFRLHGDRLNLPRILAKYTKSKSLTINIYSPRLMECLKMLIKQILIPILGVLLI